MHGPGLQVAVQPQAQGVKLLLRPGGGRLQVDEAIGRHGLGGGLQRGGEQRAVERRVDEQQVHAGRRAGTQRGDGVAALRQCAPASMQLLLIDPPFEGALFAPALQAAAQALAPDGFIYLEAPAAWGQAQLEPLGLVLHRHLKAGAVHAHLLRRAVVASDM